MPYELNNNKNAFINIDNCITNDLEYFLILIYKLKISNGNINSRHFFNDISYNLYNYAINNHSEKEEKNILQNCIVEHEKSIEQSYKKYKTKTKTDDNDNNNKNYFSNKDNNDIITKFFFTLFVNYQTINSRLMQYSNNETNNQFAEIPFDYNLISSSMKGNYALLITTPMRQDDRITIVSMAENDLRELGMLELGKSLVFNKSIKSVNYSKNRLYSYYLDYLKKGIQVFENKTVEEINISNNFFTNDIDEYLGDILKKLTNIKTLNISSNNIDGALTNFFCQIKLLTRKRRLKLENLIINKCSICKEAIYELCEFLKCKFCNLKKLQLNINNIKDDLAKSLLKSIKKNTSLKEVYLGRNFISDISTENICKIISRPNCSLYTLYLDNNEIKNNDNLLRIIARTKILYSPSDKEKKDLVDLDNNKFIHNLDIGNNEINMGNTSQIQLMEKIVDDTYLSCLDYSVYFNVLSSSKKHKNQQTKENLLNSLKQLNDQLKSIKEKRNSIFKYIDEMQISKNIDIYEKYIENKELENILIEDLGNKKISLGFKDEIFENFENNFEDLVEDLVSDKLLEALGKKEEDLIEKDNYYLVKNIIIYMLLYKINGGLINEWLRGINKCLVII